MSLCGDVRAGQMRIRLAEVKQVREKGGWLVVGSGRPYTEIAVPTDVQAYEALKEELVEALL